MCQLYTDYRHIFAAVVTTDIVKYFGQVFFYFNVEGVGKLYL